MEEDDLHISLSQIYGESLITANSQSAFAHMELLRSSLIPNYLAPKLTAKRYLHHRESESNFGIPNHSSSKNTGATAKRCAIVNRASERGDADTAVVVEKPPPKPRLFEVLPGRPTPFGATLRDGGVNFAVYSRNAALVSLCLIRLRDLPEVELTVFRIAWIDFCDAKCNLCIDVCEINEIHVVIGGIK